MSKNRTNAVAERIVAEVLAEMELGEKAVVMLAPESTDNKDAFAGISRIWCTNGRAAATATGVKRNMPGYTVFTFQGDGDAYAIGLAETVSAANRGEHIAVFVINDGVYGTFGGQASPSLPLGAKTVTTPAGRNAAAQGFPIRVCEILAQLKAPAYIARVCCETEEGLPAAKEAVRKAFACEESGKYAFVEFVASAPELGTKLENMLQSYPLGEFRV